MRAWSEFRERIRTFLFRSREERDLEEEVRFHLELETEKYLREGMDPSEAKRRALIAFGGVEGHKEAVRDAWGTRWLEDLWADVRHALRTQRKSLGVSVVAVCSLALGIGATTAIFSIVDGLILRPLPVRHADRLTLLAADDTWHGTAWSNPVWEAIRDRPELHDGAFAFSATEFNLARRGVVEPVAALYASGRMFDVLGVDALLGRTFTVDDDRRDGGSDGPVAVISHGFWQRRYGGDADVIGRTLSLSGSPFTIIGVTQPGFFGPEVGRSFDVAVPLGTVAVSGDSRVLDDRGAWWLRVMVRLAPNQSIEQATAALRSAQPRIADETRPADLRGDDAASYLVRPFTLRPAATGGSELRGTYRRPVLALMAIVGLTLLIACGNIANLMLARSTERRHELSVRRALGASNGRLARQLLTESLVLSLAGAALGVAIAVWGSRLIVAQLSTTANRIFLDVGIDGRMLAFTGALALGTALLFGIVPALRAARVAPMEALKGPRRSASSRPRVGPAGTLVTVQVALSLVLLVGAGLFIRTFVSLATLDLGFDRDHVLVVSMNAPTAAIEPDARAALYDRVLEEVRALPEVSRASLSFITPVAGSNTTRIMEIPGRPELPEAERRVWLNLIGPDWFGTLGTPLLAGRDFDDRDRRGAPRTVIVNETFARRYFGEESPIGHVIRQRPGPGADPTPLEIVGVVSDAVYRSVREAVPPTMYWPLAQQRRAPAGLSLVVRPVAGSPASIARGVVGAMSRVQPELMLAIRPLADQVDATLKRERLLATLSGFFGALALLLASLGLYGITSYAVTRRLPELGIRMALGDTPGGVVRLMLVRVAALMAGGIALGAAVSWWVSELVRGLLYGLAPRDPVTLFGAIAVLLGVGALAGWLPAVRAARIEPARVLRDG